MTFTAVLPRRSGSFDAVYQGWAYVFITADAAAEFLRLAPTIPEESLALFHRRRYEEDADPRS